MTTGNEKLWARRGRLLLRGGRALIPRRSIRLTRLGAGAILLALAIVLAAFNTGTNLLYVMGATLIALFPIQLFLGRLNLARLDARQSLRSEPHAGQLTRLQIAVTNNKRRLGSFGLILLGRHRDVQPRPFSAFIGWAEAGNQTTAITEIEFQRRGRIDLESVEIASGFPFGLFQFRFRAPAPLQALVYPRLIDVRAPVRHLAIELGGRESPEKGHGAGIHSIREYQAGDPARSIHWKLSARGQGLMVREFESEAAQGVLLVLDVPAEAAQSASTREALEQAISVTASLARTYVNRGHDVALWTPLGTVHRDGGPGQLQRIYRTLALIDPAEIRPVSSKPPHVGPEMVQVWISSNGAHPPPGHHAVDSGRVWAESQANAEAGAHKRAATQTRRTAPSRNNGGI